jgi:hypothetical protein
VTARSSGSGCTNAGPTSRCYLGGGAAAEGRVPPPSLGIYVGARGSSPDPSGTGGGAPGHRAYLALTRASVTGDFLRNPHAGCCGGSGGVTTAQEPCNIKPVAVLRFGRVASGAQAEALGCRGCDKRSVDRIRDRFTDGHALGRREMVDCTIPPERS